MSMFWMTMKASAPRRFAMFKPIAQLLMFPWKSFGTSVDDASNFAWRWTSSKLAVSSVVDSVLLMCLVG
jgi:hypothetical protein